MGNVSTLGRMRIPGGRFPTWLRPLPGDDIFGGYLIREPEAQGSLRGGAVGSRFKFSNLSCPLAIDPKLAIDLIRN